MPKCHDTQREEIARCGVRCPVPRSAWHRDHRFRPAGEKGRAKPAPPASAGLAALRLGRQHDRDDLRIDAFAALDVADAGAVEHVLYTVLDDLAQLGRNRLDVSTRLANKHRVFRPHASRVEMILIVRSEEHTSELQSLMRISYAVF